jgi:hypothetical protein
MHRQVPVQVEKEERLFGADSAAIDGPDGCPDAGVGMHSMRIITPGGISNAISVRVHAEPAMPESAVSHSEPAAAQAISAVPVVISGKLTGGGELDYYAFEARQGETFRFDGPDVGDGFRPQPDAV